MQRWVNKTGNAGAIRRRLVLGLNRGLVLAVFIGLGVVPMVLATGLTCWAMSANPLRLVGSPGG